MKKLLICCFEFVKHSKKQAQKDQSAESKKEPSKFSETQFLTDLRRDYSSNPAEKSSNKRNKPSTQRKKASDPGFITEHEYRNQKKFNTEQECLDIPKPERSKTLECTQNESVISGESSINHSFQRTRYKRRSVILQSL